MRILFLAVSAALGLAGCGATNNYLAQKQRTVEYYRIFDLKTNASRQAIAKAASDGLGRNINSAHEATPIPSSGDVPEKPGRFKLVNPFEGTAFAALASRGGAVGFRVATCDGASWTATAERNIQGSNSLKLTACLFPYKEGYHLAGC